MKFDAVLFDLDGTLWNAVQAIADSWKPIFSSSPLISCLPNLKEYEGVMGLEPQPLMKQLFPELSWEDAFPLWEKACEAEIAYLSRHGAILYDSLEETLKQLQKHLPLMIVSNCNDGYIESFLKGHQLHHYFADWECAGRSGLSKAENIQLIAKRNHLNTPVYVGDTLWDYQAAHQAGVPFIHAAYGFGTVPDVPFVLSPSDLPALILNERE